MMMSSRVSYFRVRMSNHFFENKFYCHIVYLIKKYEFDACLPVPFPKNVGNREYVVALPENMAIPFCDILESEEDCVCTFIQTVNYVIDDFVDTYVDEKFVTINGMNGVNYFLSQRVPLA